MLARQKQRELAVTLNPVEPAVSLLSPEQATLQAQYRSMLLSMARKRNASEAFLDSQSADTTPKKLGEPELFIKFLQRDLVQDILDGLFDGNGMEIKWVRGRKMKLLYTEYPLCQ